VGFRTVRLDPPLREELWVWGSGFRVQGSGFRISGPGFMVQDSGTRTWVCDLERRLGVRALAFPPAI